MDFKRARAEINAMAERLFQRDDSGKGYVCPICGSGTGKHGTGITTKDGKHFTCWAGCFSNSDIIDIIGKQYGCHDNTEALRKAAELCHIDLNEGRKDGGRKKKTVIDLNPKPHEIKTSPLKAPLPQERPGAASGKNVTPEANYTEYFEACASRIGDTDYHRSLSMETLKRFGVGYDPAWKHPSLKNPERVPASPRLIIPTSATSYVARDTRVNIPENALQYAKQKAGKVHVFNLDAFASDRPVFVVEGEIDAMSIIDVGAEAVGIGGTSGVAALDRHFANCRPKHMLIIALDNDARGKAAQEKLVEMLKERKISFMDADPKSISCGLKDANAALEADRVSFQAAVMAALENAMELERAEADKAAAEIREESVYHCMDGFFDRIKAGGGARPISTGFANLDALLDGGLYPGLYCIGAVSSLGKTTLCLQMADQIAAQERDVLIFSMEMARDELMAKSISRLTYQTSMSSNCGTELAKTTRGILTGSRYEKYAGEELAIIEYARDAYALASGYIYIVECIGDVGIKEIEERVDRHTKAFGRAPIVVVDYLQIIAPADTHATDKTNTDKAVLGLKRLSRDYQTSVIGISSFNRNSYYEPVSLMSFKESGAIEYSSDVLFGLQLAGMDYQSGETANDRLKRIRDLVDENAENAAQGGGKLLQLKVLKNRNGSRGSCYFEFVPRFNVYTPCTEDGKPFEQRGESWLSEYAEETEDGKDSGNEKWVEII